MSPGSAGERPGLDPQRPFRAYEAAAAGEAELLVAAEIGVQAQPGDELRGREEGRRRPGRLVRPFERKSTVRTAAAAGIGPCQRVSRPCGCAVFTRILQTTCGGRRGELVLHALLVCEPGGGRVDVREHAAVDAARGVEAVGEPGVGVVSLALRGIAAEPPHGHGERNREEQERGDEPEPAGPVAHSPSRRGGSARWGQLAASSWAPPPTAATQGTIRLGKR